MPDVTGTGVRFQEAIDYLKGKIPESSVAWDDLAGPVHGQVFTVAGATSADLARDIQSALSDALQQGSTLSEFRKRFDKVVADYGWTYKGSRGWRTAVIFDTNMRSAHMAGRWAQIEAHQAERPYLEYRTAGDARVRLQHRAWDRLIYPVGDSFWQTHYPPNGWGCRCTIRSYSQREMDRKGLTVSGPYKIQYRDVITRDGEIKDRVPVGIDPGWDHNVGKSWITPELALGHKLARLPSALRGPVTDKAISPAFQEAIKSTWQGFQSAVKAGSKKASDAAVVGFLDSATMDGLAAEVPAVELRSSAIAAFDAPAGTWPQEWIDNLPVELRSYKAVLWDAAERHLMVVSSGMLDDGAPVIRLQPNVATKYGSALAVTRLETVPPADLRRARYQVLVGKVD